MADLAEQNYVKGNFTINNQQLSAPGSVHDRILNLQRQESIMDKTMWKEKNYREATKLQVSATIFYSSSSSSMVLRLWIFTFS